MKRTIKIHIAGQQYILRSDADEDYVQSLAEFVNARINVLKGNRQVATQSDVVLAALKLADELHHERQVQTQLRTQARLKVQRILEQLEPYIEPPPAASAGAGNRQADRQAVPSSKEGKDGRSRRGKVDAKHA